MAAYRAQRITRRPHLIEHFLIIWKVVHTPGISGDVLASGSQRHRAQQASANRIFEDDQLLTFLLNDHKINIYIAFHFTLFRSSWTTQNFICNQNQRILIYFARFLSIHSFIVIRNIWTYIKRSFIIGLIGLLLLCYFCYLYALQCILDVALQEKKNLTLKFTTSSPLRAFILLIMSIFIDARAL